jgi:hypothetical protein
MIALFLLLVIVAIVLGIVGVVAKGLLYLLFIGIVVFPAPFCWARCGCGGDPGSTRTGNSHRPPLMGGHFRFGCAGTGAWHRRNGISVLPGFQSPVPRRRRRRAVSAPGRALGI